MITVTDRAAIVVAGETFMAAMRSSGKSAIISAIINAKLRTL